MKNLPRQALSTLDPIVVGTPSAGSKIVLLLHGLGDTGAGMKPIADFFSNELKDVTFVLPTAPSKRLL